MEEEKNKAIIYAVLFALTSVSLIVAIVRTIVTNPGNIPDHKEWDMSTDTSGGEETISMMSKEQEITTERPDEDQGAGSEQFTNQLIEKSKKEPREVVHEDLKYLKTTEGPLITPTRQPTQ